MLSNISSDAKKIKEAQALNSVCKELEMLYKKRLYPLEKHYEFDKYHSSFMDEGDFTSKPMILLIGQYSTGKTTFIQHLLEQEFPGMRVGPEPTTDGFCVVMEGEVNKIIPGNVAVADPKRPFKGLASYGNAFLNRFQVSTMSNSVLEYITIIDTPGILSGEKQRVDRGYDFSAVIRWFAQRVDRILLLFDAHKLDISDEFKRAIDNLSGYEEKIRIVLNKADSVDGQKMMRVYGALMWSLGKVIHTPEVSRVYLGSFWNRPLQYSENQSLFTKEQRDLFNDLQSLPSTSTMRKLNDMIRRARLAMVHAHIIGHLKSQMPYFFKKDKKKTEMIDSLDEIFHQLAVKHQVSKGDFPKVRQMQERLKDADFKSLHPLNEKLVEGVEKMLSLEIPKLMDRIQQETVEATFDVPKGGAFAEFKEQNPFHASNDVTINRGKYEQRWPVEDYKATYDQIFASLGPIDGRLPGSVVREHLIATKLQMPMLSRIWKLSDIDDDGYLDQDEFALASYLVKIKMDGGELPMELPRHLVPPSKLHLVSGSHEDLSGGAATAAMDASARNNLSVAGGAAGGGGARQGYNNNSNDNLMNYSSGGYSMDNSMGGVGNYHY